MIDRALRWFYGALILVTPLIVYPYTSELFEFNKMLFIYLVSLSAGGLWLIKKMKEGRLSINKEPVALLMLFFLISQVVAGLFSIDPHTSLFGYYGRFNGGIASLLSYFILFYVFVDIYSFKLVYHFLGLSLISSLVVMLWGLPGKFGHDLSCLVFAGNFSNACWTNQFHPDERMFSLIGQPNWLGAYLVVNFFIAVFFLAVERINIKKYFLVAYLLLSYVCILFTRSRSALLALLVCGFIYLIYAGAANIHKKARIPIKIYVTIFLLTILPAIIFGTGIAKFDNIFQFKNKPINQVPASLTTAGSGVTESFDIRKVVWQGAVELVKRYPILGTGTETFAYSYFFTRPAEHNLTSEWDYIYNKAHNEYLNYAATTGLTGIAAYGLMIISVYFAGFRMLLDPKYQESEKKLITLMLLSYFAILITNFFGFSTTVVNLYFYLIPAILLSMKAKRSMIFVDFNVNKEVFYSLSTVILVLQVLGVYSVANYFVADKYYAAADTLLAESQYQAAATYLLQALQLRNEHVYQDKLSYVMANLAFIAAYQKEAAAGSELISMSQKYNDLSLKSAPKNVIYWKTRAKNQYLFYQATLRPDYLQEGMKAFRRASELSPTDPRIPYSIAIYFSLMYDEERDPAARQELVRKSFEYLNASLELKPNFNDARELKKQLEKKYKITA